MQRFYFPDLEKETDSVTIKNKDFINQLTKVLRVSEGFEIIFFNGEDPVDNIFEVASIDKREIYLEKKSEIENDSEIEFDLNIFGALPNKIEKIEQIVAKGTEVGITGFYFFRSERSQKLNLSENKIARIQKIITEAAEQSGRSRIPELIIEDNISLSDFAENENIFFHTEANDSQSLKEIKLDYTKGLNLFVGPEGGWSDDEISHFKNIGFKKVHLGNRILRTETTGVVAGFYFIQK
ncbi:16S rRNA (uracil(1498)-N(3))-methyltransferase [Candidatus Gracilibacteria bacterium 28_42_T64]|nr:16S rRNA (uracil(1498)-N(3))-methyltransferase [Candidatus Gracilibacteria bacterium 28_42_T64]